MVKNWDEGSLILKGLDKEGVNLLVNMVEKTLEDKELP